MSRNTSTSRIFRIGGILLILSASIVGWFSLPEGKEARFWKIGSYTIASVSARDDDDDEEFGDDDRSSRNGEREQDDDDDERYEYRIVEDSPLVSPPQSDTIQESALPPQDPSRVATQTRVFSFDERATSMLRTLGFSPSETRDIIGQFQGLYGDITTRHPTDTARIRVLQNLRSEVEQKISDLESFSQTHPSAIFASKKKSLQALGLLAGIQIEMIQSPTLVRTSTVTRSSTVTTVSAPKTNVTTTSSVPTSTPTQPTPTVVNTHQPVVNTRTAAS